MKKNNRPRSVKKYYFLEYVYIALVSVSRTNNVKDRLKYFTKLKSKFQLGESKYKILRFENEGNEKKEQMSRYKYTLKEVLEECVLYELLKEENARLMLTKDGEKCIKLFEEGSTGRPEYKKFLLNKMESTFGAFRYLLEICSRFDKRQGLLLFPIYSPLKLGFERSQFNTTRSVLEYIDKLALKIKEELNKLLDIDLNLENEKVEIVRKLLGDKLISNDLSSDFNKGSYNIIVKRIRDFFLNKLLNVYGIKFSYDRFNIWTERGKKFGILHATDFYPGINGRIIYPTSILVGETTNKSFKVLFNYNSVDQLVFKGNEGLKLCIHSPSWEMIEEQFVKTLVEAYFKQKRIRKTYFQSLLDIKERVCYNLRISAHDFDFYLGKTYEYSISSKLKNVQISLEADKLPEETNAMYLKREPVIVSGVQKNIIAINYK